MFNRRTLAVLGLLCLAISLIARALDQRLQDAHAAVLTATTASQDAGSPVIKAWLAFNTPSGCVSLCALSRNAMIIDAISITTLIFGLAFALAALWKYVK